MERQLNTIDPNQNNIPETAIIQKVASENDRLPNGEHDKAVKAFYFSDSIASGIGKDFAFVEKIPQLIDEIIQNKSWECLYVSKSVVTPYYCRYTKGTDSENFRAFIAAKRPNGLETTIETIDRLLEAEPEVQWKFRTIIYESRQGDRTDLGDTTSYGDRKKLESELSQTQKSVIRAANRAAEAIPEIRELLDRGLIAIDIAAKLGRDIKDLDNLTAEEREYIDKRDLIGLRIKQYINTNTIPEDEDKEPAYSRKLNEFVKDLLGIKDRSKAVRMDNPKKAAEKLLQFYQGDELKELLEYLGKGLTQETHLSYNIALERTLTFENNRQKTSSIPKEEKQTQNSSSNVLSSPREQNDESFIESKSENAKDITDGGTYQVNEKTSSVNLNGKSVSRQELSSKKISEDSFVLKTPLTLSELAERLGRKPRTITVKRNESLEEFLKWTKQKDPDGIAWERSEEKQGKSYLYFPVEEAKEENG
jgi:hypothetical protein